MSLKPFQIERRFQVPVQTVWKAITEKEEMKKWYFDLKEFITEPGFEFHFESGPSPERMYLHVCEIREVIPGKKLSYSWRYDGYPGNSLVTFELFREENHTRVRLTHDGLESFPATNPDLARENFEKGWTEIIGTSLKD